MTVVQSLFLRVKRDTSSFAIMLGILLSALIPSLIADDFPSTFSFKCNDGETLTVQFENDNAWLFLPDKTTKLPKRVSASGAKYSDRNITFWSKGNEAMLLVRGNKAAACVVNEAATVWEVSKLDGADFRAIGAEPAWELLLFRNAIILSTDYGAVNRVFKHASVYEDKKKKTTTYDARESGHTIELVLSRESCTDDKSDETFETSVSILLDGKQKLSGCGRALH